MELGAKFLGAILLINTSIRKDLLSRINCVNY
jgi:hypothetical protein